MPPLSLDQPTTATPKRWMFPCRPVIEGVRARAAYVAFEENRVTQVETLPAPPPRAAPAAHHHHHHPQHYRYSAISLLGASVITRLAVVAGVSVLLWGAIVWALA
jgi:hypothetical protein